MTKIGEKVDKHNIAVVGVKKDIRREPLDLPKGFEWCEVNDFEELRGFLSLNYVEDSDNTFRFDYSKEFLEWALKPPGYKNEWHLGVRKDGVLVGFISAIPLKIIVNEKELRVVEINYLCLHKVLRDKRFAPLLIKEITRRANINGIFQAVYTTGNLLPIKPISEAVYYHRALNPKKLLECGFSELGPNMKESMYIKLNKVNDKKYNWDVVKESDVGDICMLVNDYLKGFQVYTLFQEDEIRHWFLGRDGVFDVHVLRDNSGKVTDLVSFYTINLSVNNGSKHKRLMAAYSYYTICKTVPFKDAMNNMFYIAKNKGYDVYNTLNIFGNKPEVLGDLKFKPGNGHLLYYLYNWHCKFMLAGRVGIPML